MDFGFLSALVSLIGSLLESPTSDAALPTPKQGINSNVQH